MQRVVHGSVEKTDWPVGPWHEEPDELDFLIAGTRLRGACRRHSVLGSWQSFVLVPKSHPYYGAAPEIPGITVHFAFRWPDDQRLWAIGIDLAAGSDAGTPSERLRRAPRWPRLPSGPPLPYATLEEAVVVAENLAKAMPP